MTVVKSYARKIVGAVGRQAKKVYRGSKKSWKSF